MPETKREFYGVCPSCWSVRVKRRTYKTPKYLCEVCGAVFNQKKRISYDQRKMFNDLLAVVRDELKIHDIIVHGSTTRQCVAAAVKRLKNA